MTRVDSRAARTIAATIVVAGVLAWPAAADDPPSAPGPTAVGCAYAVAATGDCWVTGDFVASVAPATGGTGGVANYQICRSYDAPGTWAGCDVNLTLTGGTSIVVSGANLPSDGYWRAYYFRAQDTIGVWGGWNSPRFVRVDRYAPTVSASNASDLWFTSLTATLSASDSVAGAGANSGLRDLRYAWNAPLDGWCSSGTPAAPGTTLSAPIGDNVLYLCARDNTGRVSQWSGRYRVSNPPTAPGPTTVSCAYAVAATGDCWVTGDFVASVYPATGGTGGVANYQICRSYDAPGTWAGCDVNLTLTGGTSIAISGANLPADGYWRAYYFRAQDAAGLWGAWNSPRFVRVDRYAPTVSASNASDTWSSSLSATVSADDNVGGAGANSGLQAVRYSWNAALDSWCTAGSAASPGTTLSAPVGDNVLYVCARDNAGRVSQWSGRYRVNSPPSAPGPTTVACAYAVAATGDCWVTGDFTASVTAASGGTSPVANYQICRSYDAPGTWAGCDVNLTLTGGTSMAISGANLPADGFWRAYYFRAQDTAGFWGSWNSPRFVRVDRYAPAVSASNASDEWFSSRTATLSADDSAGGASANSGLQAVRYAWNAALDGGCTTGTAASPGTTLGVPVGDNVLYVCARDNAGRVSQWSGRYRVNNPPSAPGPTTVSCAYAVAATGDCWVTGDFTASVTPATGGTGGIANYQICRSNDAPGTWAGCDVNLTLTGGTSIVVSGANLPSDDYWRAYYFRAQDPAGFWGPWNSPRFVRVDRYAPTVSASNASDEWFTSRTATLSADDSLGGAGANSGLQAVRYAWNAALDAGCTTGTAAAPGTTLTASLGDSVLYVCARDNAGRVSQWSGRYRVNNPPSAPGPTTVSCAYAVTSTGDCWVTGDFTASVTAATGGTGGIANYQICRSNDAPGTWAGCEVNLTLTGGTSIVVAGTDLPSDGYWRAFYFRAQDTIGAWGSWNAPRFVRVDRYAPAVSASNASDEWFTSRTATLSADDSAGGAGANSGLQVVRYSWNTALDSGCTTGTVTASGATLNVSQGDNVLFLCARDNTGRVAQWSGRYRVANPAPSLVVSVGGTVVAPSGTIAWGQVAQASGSIVSKNVLVANGAPAGGSDLVLEHSPANVEVVNTQGNAFRWTGTLNSPLAAGLSDDFAVMLDASQPGAAAAVLRIWHNDPSRPNPLLLNLTALVAAAPPEVSATTPLVISNRSEAILTVQGLHLQGASVNIATVPYDDGGISTATPIPVPIGPPPAILDASFPTVELLGVNADGTALTVRVTFDQPGIEGFFNLDIATSGGRTGAPFRVVGAAPVVDVFTPSQPVAGNIHLLTLTGANLRGAKVVPLDSRISVLDLDNKNDGALMGLLYVHSDAPVGATDIRIETPDGASTVLSMEVVASVEAASVSTSRIEVPNQPTGPDMPEVLLQEPVLAHPDELQVVRGGAGRRLNPQGAIAPSASGPRPESFCFYATDGVRQDYSAILLSLTDVAGNPLTRDVLNKLVPGDRINFNSLTLAVAAYAEVDFLFQVCGDWVTTVRVCFHGGVAFMVPLVGGQVYTYDFCAGNGGTTQKLGANGFLTDQHWTSSNACLAVDDADPRSRSGQRSGDIALNCCGNPTDPGGGKFDLAIHISGRVWDQDFDVEGPVTTVEPEACAVSEGPNARLGVFLDVDRDNLAITDGKLDLSHTYAPVELDDSASYLPCSNLDDTSVAPSALPQRVSLIAAFVQTDPSTHRLRIVEPPAGISLEVKLQNTSKLTGKAINWPPDLVSEIGKEDFWLGSTDYEQSATVSFGGPDQPSAVARVELACNDYGGSTTVVAKVVNAETSDPTLTASLTLPVPRASSADVTSTAPPLPQHGWTAFPSKVKVDTGNLKVGDDKDDNPAGKTAGDGLSAFSEYRGVVVDGRHFRLDPGKKNLFVAALTAFPDVGGARQLGLDIYRPLLSELYERPAVANEKPEDQMLVINIHSQSAGIDHRGVPAVRLLEDFSATPPANAQNPFYPLGLTANHVWQDNGVTTTIFQQRIEDAHNKNPQTLRLDPLRDWILSHELGHAVDICHREEIDANGNVKASEHNLNCTNGTPISQLVPRSQIPGFVDYMHSGTVFNRITSQSVPVAPTSYHQNDLKQMRLQ